MSFLPSGFLWRLTILNTLIIIAATAISGWAIYSTACFLAAGMANMDAQRQQQFNSTLLNYLWVFLIMAVSIGSLLHFYLTKRLIQPVRRLIQSTEQLKRGYYPEPVEVYKKDEIGQLVVQYNELIEQLQTNEQQRKKLVSDLSHEIRTPLSNLNGYLLALKDGDITGDQVLFSSLHKESERLSQMVEQLDQLKEWDHLSSRSTVEKETIEIADVLHQCATMFEWTLNQNNIELQIEAESSDVTVHVEGIQQALSNLIGNAIRYYEGVGVIVLKGKRVGSDYRVSVTGPGKPIPGNERKNIFKRFYRLDSSRSRDTGGSGLGLAITKEIVGRHHGEIGLETTFNSNTFWFVLPLDGGGTD